VPLYRVHEVASYFPQFRFEAPKKLEVGVCRDMSCRLRGSADVLSKLKALADADGAVLAVRGVSCLGRCDRAPAVSLSRYDGPGYCETFNYLGRAPEAVCDAVRRHLDDERAPGDSDSTAPDDSGRWEIDVYRGKRDYRAVRLLADEVRRTGSLDAVRKLILGDEKDAKGNFKRKGILELAGLLGLGGPGARTYKKWNEVLDARADRARAFVVCNADESEPGTFKDRELLLRLPHVMLEGMIIAGMLLEAQKGYVYIRHEYEEEIDAVRDAIDEAVDLGVCGRNILDTGLSFDVEVFESPGGYICGEWTALIEAIEDRRAEPRNRPPEPQTNGLWDEPTLLNNVETFAWVPRVLLGSDGSGDWDRTAEWYKRRAAPSSHGQSFTGKRLFSISGDVNQPGVYEVSNGITLGELIRDFAGGVRGGALKAVATSGPSGGFLPRRLPLQDLEKKLAAEVRQKRGADTADLDVLDLELDVRFFRLLGGNFMLGAGLVVYNDTRDMLDEAIAALEFFRNESCGKCVPCRIGSQKLVEVARRRRSGKLAARDVYDGGAARVAIDDLAVTMNETSICGLGKVAPNPLLTLLRYFRSDVERDGQRSGVVMESPDA
jgi:NADH:ubiquinone oxidoreductase subunit F (NADH-binding)